MGVPFRHFDTAVAQELADRIKGSAILNQPGRERMPERVNDRLLPTVGHPFIQAQFVGG
jgi:hypothetical protein